MSKKFLIPLEVKNISDKLPKKYQKQIYEILENHYSFEKYCRENDNINLSQLLEKSPIFYLIIEEPIISDIDYDNLTDYMTGIFDFMQSKSFIISPQLKKTLLDYLFHREDMGVFREKYFSYESDIKSFTQYYNFFCHSLSYLYLEKNHLISCILKNKNLGIYEEFLKIENNHSIDYFSKNYFNFSEIDLNNYKKYFHFVKEQTPLEDLFPVYSSMYKLINNEVLKPFIIEQCTIDFDLPSIFHTEILFNIDYIEKKEKRNFRTGRKFFNEAVEQLIQAINKASATQTIVEFFDFLEINEIPTQYYKHLQSKYLLETTMPNSAIIKNKSLNKI